MSGRGRLGRFGQGLLLFDTYQGRTRLSTILFTIDTPRICGRHTRLSKDLPVRIPSLWKTEQCPQQVSRAVCSGRADDLRWANPTGADLL